MVRANKVGLLLLAATLACGCGDSRSGVSSNEAFDGLNDTSSVTIRVLPNSFICSDITLADEVAKFLGAYDVGALALSGVNGLRSAFQERGVPVILNGTTRFQPAYVNRNDKREANRLCDPRGTAIFVDWVVQGDPENGNYEARAIARQRDAEISEVVRRNHDGQWIDGYSRDFRRSIRFSKSLAKDNDELARRLVARFVWTGAGE